ncbi:universal stress protein [Belliella pelovolcani]|uniref:Nucleotide-binding universal stress protein, UspA family n=1 Tax=Belliella pelovolcani TaxID=529505 RepID=A0A1N7LQ65_9BACT|nr:universal stress protein [Belliella pelovolcani]SIS75924.1 Nucleotide-binding universal stress protein, UspA family [Belliella pelovolcani]
MKTSFKIICPTDFSECSLNAIEYAAKLGEKYGAELCLLHIPDKDDYQKLSAKDFHSGDQYSFIKKKLTNLQTAVKDESLSNGLKSCTSEIREGKIVDTIVNFAEELNADLIVMGTEGVNDFKKNFIGTRSSKVVEKASTDVLLVPRKVYFKAPRKFVYATDYIEEDKIAIQKIVELAGFFDSEIDLVHVSTKSKSIDKSLHMTMVEEIRPFVKYEKANYVLKSYRDEPGLGLENYLITAKGDVLVTLSKKKSWFDQLFSQNLSRKMSYFINKPLFVIKKL